MIKTLLTIAVGGGLGSVLRFILQRSFTSEQEGGFPTGTLIVNLTGCLLIGILWGLSERTNALSSEMKLFLFTGLCGGFTTYSAYSQESMLLLRDGKFYFFLLYAGSTLLAGFCLTWIGYYLSK